MRRILGAALIIIFGTSSSALAQSNANARDGFTISFGLGGGSAAVTCAGCGTSPRETGMSGYLRLGGAVSPNLILAGESNGWTKNISGVDTQLGSLMAVAQWYPAATGGFYVKGGAGLGAYSESDNTGKLESMGFGYQAGTGYDIRLASNFSLTPYVNYLGMMNGNIKVNGTSMNQSMGTNNFQYGLGLTWH